MAVVVNTNISSVHAARALASNRLELEQAMERLSSGKRLNSARDDAAGMSVVTRMTSQIQGLNMAVRNANDGISIANTYDGAADETGNILNRMRELAVQMANGTYVSADRANSQVEFSALISEISRIASKTVWNGSNAIASADGSASIQVGFNSSDTVTIAFASLAADDLTVSGLTVSTASDANAALSAIDSALTSVNSARAAAGAGVNRLEHTVANLMNIVQRTEEARSRIQDTDFAAESANLAKANVLAQAGTAMLAQANQSPQYVLSLLKG